MRSAAISPPWFHHSQVMNAAPAAAMTASDQPKMAPHGAPLGHDGGQVEIGRARRRQQRREVALQALGMRLERACR